MGRPGRAPREGPSPRPLAHRGLAANVAPLVGAHALLLLLWDLAAHPFATVGVLAIAFAAWARAVHRLEGRLDPGSVLAVAILLRALLLPLPPTLSDDVLRYVWDGRVTAAGFDPYRLAPEAEELAPLRDARWRAMPHKEVPTVYPPLALTVFTVAAATPAPILTLKLLLTAAELLGVALLLRLATALGRPVGRAAWYAWCPLATLEVAGSGHVDGLVVLFSVATVLVLVRPSRAPLAAGALAAGAVLSKLSPLVVLPVWARAFRGRRALAWTFLVGATTLTVAGALPMLSRGGPPGLGAYGVRWEFNGPLYEPLWRSLDRLGTDDAVKGWLDRRKERTGEHARWNRFYPHVYPQFLAKLILGAVFVVLFVVMLFRPDPARDPVAATGRGFGLLLLTAATVYPWYLLWVLPWAALGRHRAWLVLAATSTTSYLAQLTSIPLFPWLWLVTYLPFVLLTARSRWSTA